MSKWPTSRKSSQTCPNSAYPLPALQPLIPSTLSAVSQLACLLSSPLASVWSMSLSFSPFAPMSVLLCSLFLHNTQFFSPWKGRKFNFEEKGVFGMYLVMVMVTLYMVNPSANIIKWYKINLSSLTKLTNLNYILKAALQGCCVKTHSKLWWCMLSLKSCKDVAAWRSLDRLFHNLALL